MNSFYDFSCINCKNYVIIHIRGLILHNLELFKEQIFLELEGGYL